MKRYLKIFLILLSFLLAANSLADSNDFIVPVKVLSVWGYKSKSFTLITQSHWEQATFGKATISQQKIKALKEIKDWRNAYYRFTLTREIYATEKHAEYRVNNLRLYPPGVNTKMKPEYVLRKGFRVKNTVYIIATDVVKFEIEELPRVFALFKQFAEKNDSK